MADEFGLRQEQLIEPSDRKLDVVDGQSTR